MVVIKRVDCSYTMAWPPVRGDNPQVLSIGLSYVHADKHAGITILYHLHQCMPCTVRAISCYCNKIYV